MNTRKSVSERFQSGEFGHRAASLTGWRAPLNADSSADPAQRRFWSAKFFKRGAATTD